MQNQAGLVLNASITILDDLVEGNKFAFSKGYPRVVLNKGIDIGWVFC